jgi:hypothetical protein
VRLIFADLGTQALCADAVRATTHWGAGWVAVSLCLSLLLDSLDVADLRRWAALDIQVVGPLVHVTHRGAVVTLVPVTDDGQTLSSHQEGVMDDLNHIRIAQVIDVVCDGKRAATQHRAH